MKISCSKFLFVVATGTVFASGAFAQQGNECVDASALAFDTLTTYDNLMATSSGPAFSCFTGNNSVWFTFTSTADYTATICINASAPITEIYEGSCGALVSVGCALTGGNGCSTSLEFAATTGTQYWVRIGTYLPGFEGFGSFLLVGPPPGPTLNSDNGHYYQIISDQLTHDEAHAAAQSLEFMGRIGHLATISDAAENAFVGGLGSDRVWLGGVQNPNAQDFSEPSGGWTWVTGEPFTYTNWQAMEPNNFGGSEGALEMDGSGRWNDSSSNISSVPGYVVEFDVESTPIENPTNGRYYLPVDADILWEDAREAASFMTFRGFRGHLVTITSEAERDFVDTVVPAGRNSWLGGFQDTNAPDYAEPGGGWRWVTGEPFGYTDWAANEPSNSGAMGESFLELFGSVFPAVGWNDVTSFSTGGGGYVVEFGIPLAPVLNPTNGSHYLSMDADLTWQEARDAAAELSFNGVRGHLVTIASEAERDFVDTVVPAGRNRWLGGFQDTNAPDYAEPGGGWRWVTGEPFAYTDWAANEPSNSGPIGESFLELFGSVFPAVGWNDVASFSTGGGGYVVEFPGTIGDVACLGVPNSTGVNGTLTAMGSRVAADSNLELGASNLPPGQFGMFLTARAPILQLHPLGGLLCLGGPIGRFTLPSQIRQADASGRFSLMVDTSMVPTPFGTSPILSGETHYFQVWHRDTMSNNFTDSLVILFE